MGENDIYILEFTFTSTSGRWKSCGAYGRKFTAEFISSLILWDIGFYSRICIIYHYFSDVRSRVNPNVLPKRPPFRVEL